MSRLTPWGTARARVAGEAAPQLLYTGDPEQFDLAYLGWEVARCAPALSEDDRRALAALAAATLASIRGGSTRVPVDSRLAQVLEAVGAQDQAAAARALLTRAREAAPDDPVSAVIGPPGARTPLVVDGEWLYAGRMRALDEAFCARVRAQLARPAAGDDRTARKVLKAVAGGPPPLTDEQSRAVKAALTAPLALITGGPGTGKTTIVVALLRALHWTGVQMGSVAIAAPTGKAAQRMQQALDAGLGATSGDLAAAGLKAIAPMPQTLHRLLGWSPSSGRFARHENDPLPHRVVIVDEASMIDLAMMDRLFRALHPTGRLVLLGDADQLPSVEAGAVFRDLCAALGGVRLTTNLRVAADPSARRIVATAEAVNAGASAARLRETVETRRSVGELRFEGVEHLDRPWSEVADALVDRWWSERVAALPGFRERVGRTFQMRSGELGPDDAAELLALLEHHGRSRVLCATRVRGMDTSALEVSDRLMARLGVATVAARRVRPGWLAAGAPVLVERNDYARQLHNGDQGIVVRVADEGHAGARLMAVFPRRGGSLEAFPAESIADLAPAFAMSVHKAQGSEYDHVAVVLPEADMPLLTRELLYTAITRARRSVLVVGSAELLARAVERPIGRHSGVAERLGVTAR